jgi:hypothetical protein
MIYPEPRIPLAMGRGRPSGGGRIRRTAVVTAPQTVLESR